ncbi:MAG: hypothetical protein ATN35_13010, partial [Epulopiscium sp. Nele67-Bin004]
MIKWLDKYEVGNETIDAQHKVLFDIAQETEELLTAYEVDKYDSIMNLIQRLKDYTMFHFEQEEEIMLKAKYSKFFSHLALHEEFIDQLDKIILKLDTEMDEKVIRDMLVFSINWITDHI